MIIDWLMCRICWSNGNCWREDILLHPNVYSYDIQNNWNPFFITHSILIFKNRLKVVESLMYGCLKWNTSRKIRIFLTLKIKRWQSDGTALILFGIRVNWSPFPFGAIKRWLTVSTLPSNGWQMWSEVFQIMANISWIWIICRNLS